MFKRFISTFICITFSFSNLQYIHAQDFNINQLPVPGTMVGKTVPFAPLTLKGLVVNVHKPLEFQFIVDTGNGPQDTISVKEEASQLVKYFLTGLTIPESDLWVNLSPYEKNRMVPETLGQTDLGRDLLAQDYILKQLTASLIYPEKDLGKEFWNRVYAKAQTQFGTTNIPVKTFNKVWILPDQAQVFENNNAAYVTKSTLKVMLDEDYLALSRNGPQAGHSSLFVIPAKAGIHNKNNINTLGSQIVREIVIPEITKEVNTGKNFAPLRQIYQALILAKWYKETIQNGLLDALYTNKNKVTGVNLNDPTIKEQIYNRYLQAYKKGAFNYIKDDPTPDGQVVPRKYFSGGFKWAVKLRRDGAMTAIQKIGTLFALVISLGSATIPALAQSNTQPNAFSTDGHSAVELVVKRDLWFGHPGHVFDDEFDVEVNKRADMLVTLGKPAVNLLSKILIQKSGIDDLDHLEIYQRIPVAIALGKIGGEEAKQGLIAGLKDKEYRQWSFTDGDREYDRRSIAKALEQTGWEPRTINEKILFYMALNKDEEIVKIGQPAIQELLGLIKERSLEGLQGSLTLGEIKFILDTLRKIGGQAAINAFSGILQLNYFDQYEHTELVVSELVKMGQPAVPLLVALYNENGQGYIREALDKLGANWYDRLSVSWKISLWGFAGIVTFLSILKVATITNQARTMSLKRKNMSLIDKYKRDRNVSGLKQLLAKANGDHYLYNRISDVLNELGDKSGDKIYVLVNSPGSPSTTYEDYDISYGIRTVTIEGIPGSANWVLKSRRDQAMLQTPESKQSQDAAMNVKELSQMNVEELARALEEAEKRGDHNRYSELSDYLRYVHNDPRGYFYYSYTKISEVPIPYSGRSEQVWGMVKHKIQIDQAASKWTYDETVDILVNPANNSTRRAGSGLANAILRLGRFGKREAIPMIIDTLQQDDSISHEAIMALIKLGYAHVDVLERLKKQETKSGLLSSNVYRYLNQAIAWQKDGYGFKVTYIPEESHWVVNDYDSQLEKVIDRPEVFRFERGDKLSDHAMLETSKVISKAKPAANGGIDLNQIAIKRTGHVIKVQFDQAQLTQLKQEGFEGFTPVITSMTRITTPFQLLCVNIAELTKALAKV